MTDVMGHTGSSDLVALTCHNVYMQLHGEETWFLGMLMRQPYLLGIMVP